MVLVQEQQDASALRRSKSIVTPVRLVQMARESALAENRAARLTANPGDHALEKSFLM
jgi:hypothetical protein